MRQQKTLESTLAGENPPAVFSACAELSAKDGG
jgi:hypothetical protein